MASTIFSFFCLAFIHLGTAGKYDHGSHEKKYDHGSHEKKYDHGSHENKYDHGSHENKYDHGSHENKYDHGSHENKYDHGFHENKYDHGSHENKYDELEHKWSCATTWQWEKPGVTIKWSLSETLAEAAVQTDCPSRKNRMNNCCVAHSGCYNKQLGQENCDNDFCECMEKATKGEKRCSIWEGPGFCRHYRLHGESAYRAAAPPFWSSCGTILNTQKYLGCPCGKYKTWERCGFLYMGYRYLCYSCKPE